MSLVSILKGRRGESGFGYASTASEVTADLDLRGKTILITGARSGLGLESARVLAARGARILAAARSLEQASEVCQQLGADAVPLACDLSEPRSVQRCVAEVQRAQLPIDALIANAGVMALPDRQLRHGQELQFLTNHIGHFILVTGLLPQLTAAGRVVMLSSGAHNAAPQAGIQFDDLTLERSYSPWRAYGQSKLANLLFARALAKRFQGTARTANAVHPGVIDTPLNRHMSLGVRLLYPVASAIAMKSIAQGAATQCYVAVHPAAASIQGEYLADCNLARSSKVGRDSELAERLWSATEKIVAAL